MTGLHDGNGTAFTRNRVLKGGKFFGSSWNSEDASKSTYNCHPVNALKHKCYGIIPHQELSEDTLSCLHTGRQRVAALGKQMNNEHQRFGRARFECNLPVQWQEFLWTHLLTVFLNNTYSIIHVYILLSCLSRQSHFQTHGSSCLYTSWHKYYTIATVIPVFRSQMACARTIVGLSHTMKSTWKTETHVNPYEFLFTCHVNLGL